MNVAIVYDRVNKWGGAERVLLTLHEMFPNAPFYTSVYNEGATPWAKAFPKIYTSFLQKIPFSKKYHEFLALLMPIAFESFNFDKYDLIVSVTSESAKGIITKPGTIHICYCLTPTRYLWSHYDFYFKNVFLRYLSKPFVNYLRRWDKIASNRPDKIIAISGEVKNRIKKYYRINSEIIYPPVELADVKRKKSDKEDFYLVVSRLVPYKKVDLVIKVFNRLKYPLIIVGVGSESRKLRLGVGKNIRFVGEVTDSELIEYYGKAKALIMPQEEDFGLVSIEAQSFGLPVIAYKKGGAIETIIDGETGVLFDRQNEKSLTDAVRRFEKINFVVDNLYTNAQKFSEESFKRKIARLI